MGVQAVISYASLQAPHHPQRGQHNADQPPEPPQLLVFVFILSVSVSLALSILLGWHVYLTATGQVVHVCHTFAELHPTQ